MDELALILPLCSADPPSTLHNVWSLELAGQAALDTERRIQLSCGGLIEVVRATHFFTPFKNRRSGVEHKLATRVQFIHQSVKDYLNSTEDIRELSRMRGGADESETSGHQLLLTACLRYLQLPEAIEVRDRQVRQHKEHTNTNGVHVWSDLSKQCPLLPYSPHWVRHADKSVSDRSLSVSRLETVNTMEAVFRAWGLVPGSNPRAGG